MRVLGETAGAVGAARAGISAVPRFSNQRGRCLPVPIPAASDAG